MKSEFLEERCLWIVVLNMYFFITTVPNPIMPVGLSEDGSRFKNMVAH
jgi:hypothetical protein